MRVRSYEGRARCRQAGCRLRYQLRLLSRMAVLPAGFHNAELYEGLRDSCGPLVALLQDEEEKTRANAAGALGNLVRNSSLLCRPLIQAGALQARSPASHQSILRQCRPLLKLLVDTASLSH